MIIDKHLELSDAQTITTTAVSTNVIDVGGEYNAHEMNDLKVVLNLDEAFTAAGAATLTIAIQESADEAFSAPVAYTLESALPVAGLLKDKQYVHNLPLALSKKYIRMNYTVATGPMTAGKISAFITNGFAAKKDYKGV